MGHYMGIDRCQYSEKERRLDPYRLPDSDNSMVFKIKVRSTVHFGLIIPPRSGADFTWPYRSLEDR